MLDRLQYQILKRIAPDQLPEGENPACDNGRSTVDVYLKKDELINLVRGKTVIDFGCGEGGACLDLARFGAKKVVGIDIRQSVLDKATSNAVAAGLDDRCEFLTSTDTKADVIVSFDAFEHFDDPAETLEVIHDLLEPGGCVIVRFGPTWYHPLGGHLFSVFPWAHLVFSEAALIQWRSTIRSDGATRFREVSGGLNQITIARFERVVAASKFELVELETVPIRPLRSLHSRLTREFTTAVVRAKLIAKR